MQFPRITGALVALAIASVALAEPPQPGEAENPGGEYGLTGQPGAETLNQRAQQADPTQGVPAGELDAREPQAEPALAAVPASKAFDLPATADRLRAAGFPEGEVDDALEAAKDAKITASDAAALFDAMLAMPLPTGEEARDELGDVVEKNVEEGLRGQALLTAIHADLMAHAGADAGDGGSRDAERPITDPNPAQGQ